MLPAYIEPTTRPKNKHSKSGTYSVIGFTHTRVLVVAVGLLIFTVFTFWQIFFLPWMNNLGKKSFISVIIQKPYKLDISNFVRIVNFNKLRRLPKITLNLSCINFQISIESWEISAAWLQSPFSECWQAGDRTRSDNSDSVCFCLGVCWYGGWHQISFRVTNSELLDDSGSDFMKHYFATCPFVLRCHGKVRLGFSLISNHQGAHRFHSNEPKIRFQIFTLI